MDYFIIEEKKLIICWSPKCGSTTIKHLILKYYGIQIDLNETYHKKLKELSVNKKIALTDIDNYNEYKIILVIRNPYHRLVSGFYGKYVREGSPYKNPPNCKCFLDFIHILSHTPDLIDKHHFQPQCSGDTFKMIFKMKDNINMIEMNQIEIIANELDLKYDIDDIKNMKKNIKIYRNQDIKTAYLLNYQELRDYVITDYSLFYNKEIISIVNKIYSIDFNFFISNNYNFRL